MTAFPRNHLKRCPCGRQFRTPLPLQARCQECIHAFAFGELDDPQVVRRALKAYIVDELVNEIRSEIVTEIVERSEAS